MMNINPSNPSDDQSAQAGEPVVMNIRHLSQQQLMQLGVSQIAYVKRVDTDAGVAFAIHAADGTPMAIAADQDVALAAIRQHEMLPALVH
jgi:hypothetical protein